MSKENSGGFFKKFHDTISESFDDIITNNFMNLNSNGKRVSYLNSLPAVKNYSLRDEIENIQKEYKFPVVKDAEKARNLKLEGNAAVQKGDWKKAFQFYSGSLICMPQKEAEETAILLANRSAALNHLEHHEDALSDIKRCLSLGYPRNLHYKVLERRARCLLVLKRHQEAISAFQDTITALDDAKLDKTKTQKMQTDSKIMVEVLKKGQALAGNPKDPEPIKKIPPKPKLLGKNNPKYPSASDSLDINYEESKGRYAVATRDIIAGEILLIEKPYSGVLLASFSRTHCQNCLMKCFIPVPCPNCTNVIFCSDKCLKIALHSFHAYECPILPLIWQSGCSITCHIALRMIIQNKKEFFKDIVKDLETKPEIYKTDDYRNAYHLVTHEDKMTKQDLIHRTQMVVFLVKLLELSGYFQGMPKSGDDILEQLNSMSVADVHIDNAEFYGGFILRNLQILKFNAHEVFELQCPKPNVGKNVIKHAGDTVFIAGAIFPTLALFNHSCDPGVARYFCGSTIVVRAVKNIKKGDEVAENYGPMFTIVPKPKRVTELREQYWFDCTCKPCLENWPLYEEMNEDYMRFKCDSARPCPNVVAVPHNAQEFMIQCGLCQQYTNIMKGLKSLQDTDMMYRLAQFAMSEGKYGEALKKFVEVLKLYDATLAPPYRSYYECVQNIRRCMLSMGNYSIVNST